MPCRVDHEDPSRFQLGLGAGGFDTTLKFDDDQKVDVKMTSIALSGAWILGDRWTARLSAGAIVDGTLEPHDSANHELDSGFLIALGGEYHVQDGNGGGKPAIDLSLALSASWAKTKLEQSEETTDYQATDLRLGVRTAWVVGQKFFPYAAARVFGGPVKWELQDEDVTGSDIHHYQVAVGLGAQLGRIGLFAEYSGLGEKSLNAGVSTAW